MEVVFQKLMHMRNSLGRDGITDQHNYLPMIVDKRALEFDGKSSAVYETLARHSNFVAFPLRDTNDVIVFDKGLYLQLRDNACTDETIVDIYETFVGELQQVEAMDKILCPDS